MLQVDKFLTFQRSNASVFFNETRSTIRYICKIVSIGWIFLARPTLMIQFLWDDQMKIESAATAEWGPSWIVETQRVVLLLAEVVLVYYWCIDPIKVYIMKRPFVFELRNFRVSKWEEDAWSTFSHWIHFADMTLMQWSFEFEYNCVPFLSRHHNKQSFKK